MSYPIKEMYVKKYNIITGILLIFVGAYVVNNSFHFQENVNGTPGPGFWPRVLGIAIIFVAALLILTTIIGKKKLPEHLIDIRSKGFFQVLETFGLMILFAFGLNLIGFLLSSLIFVVLMMLIMGVRSVKKICISSVAITLSIYLIFSQFLNVVLPRGKLFF